MDNKELAYDRISDNWEEFISSYDTDRRIEVLVNDFLGEGGITGKKCLDAGCGLGYFSKALLGYKPADLSANDISSRLVKRLSEKFPAVHCFVADILELPASLLGKTFDVVVCSDVIEHTSDPKLAIKKLAQAVCGGGLLSISVPNRRWLWLLRLAQVLGLRKNYQGWENWVSPGDFLTWITKEGFEILRCEGIHTVPFKLFPQKPLRFLDQKLRNFNYPYALNLAILARKK
ncbi:MAG: methyltransferase domain-containing protein [Candidatus Omnitrophica bacterium]|nr:methyltransferase domain-containing protein [Candidatus Omnitrophota bacterium]